MNLLFTRCRKGLFLLFCILSVNTVSAVVAISNNFTAWSSSGLAFVNTNRPDGWSGSSVRIGPKQLPTFTISPPHGTGCFFNSMSTASNSWLQIPVLSNGIGMISVVGLPSAPTSWSGFDFQVSSNGIDNWVTLTNVVFPIAGGIWTNYDIVINYYTPTFFRFLKTSDNGGASYYCFDQVLVHHPPARVVITNIALVPSPVYSNGSFNLTARIPTQGIISNLTATNFYRIGTSGVWTALGMASNGPDSWITTNFVPGQLPGTTIQYVVTAYFQGPDAMSPTSYPSGGTSAPLSFVVKSYPLSDYLPTSMAVFGALATNMILVRDYSWEALLESPSPLTNAGIRWRGVPRNNPTTTNTWGENNQSDFIFRLEGVAEAGGGDVILPGTNSGQFVLTFNETNGAYIVNHGYWENFDAWNYATTSRAGWIATNGVLITDPARILRNNSLLLGTSNNVQSTFLRDGIGEVVFSYRNYQTNGLPSTSLSVQKSTTGSALDTEWFTLTNILNISTTDYVRTAFTVEDRNSRYIRIRNTSTNGFLALDEIRIHDPYYSGIVGSNLTLLPSVPTATNSVTISLDIQPFSGASNIQATLYYRPAGSTPYTSISLSNVSGITYTTISAIPAGIGPIYRAGNIEYYIRCTFTGDQSSLTSPVLFPNNGSNNPAFFTIQNATTLVEHLTMTPDPPLTLTTNRVDADITPLAAASNVVAYLYYRFGTSGLFSQIPMTAVGTHYHCYIPSFSNPGTPLQYYIQTVFLGPGAPLLNNYYPPYGSSSPITTLLRAAPLSTLNSSLSLSGSFATNLMAVSNYFWQGVASVSNLVNPSFRFVGFAGSTNIWGDSDPAVTQLPLFGTAGDLNGDAIQISGVLTGYYRFRFDEISRNYSVVKCQYLNFDNWSGISAYGTYTNSEQWVIGNARGTIVSDDDQARVFLGKSGIMNDNGAQPYIRSPNLTEGVGEISFWYRNWESNGVTPGAIVIEKAANSAGPWTRIGQITNILSFDYLFYYLPHSDRNSHYVRLVSSNLPPRLCFDEITLAEPPAGVIFTNLTLSPGVPAVTNPVTVSVTITDKAGASNLNVSVYYRPAGGGIFSQITMYPTNGNQYVTSTPIPQGIGPDGGAGLIEYYVQCGFEGYFSSTFSPEFYPTTPTNYRIVAASVIMTNLTLVPNPPLVDTNFDLWLDVLPQASAYDVRVTAFYRFANSGGFSSQAMALQGSNRYKTTVSLPPQSNPGTPLQFYFTIEFSGPAALSPTNYPSAGSAAPFSNIVYRTQALTSNYSRVDTTGSFTGSLIRIDDGVWQGVVSITNLINPSFWFAGFISSTSYWGDANQSISNLPAHGYADLNGNPILLSDAPSGRVLLRFNETDQNYSIQRCAAYVDFDDWATLPTQTFGTYTNTELWTLTGSRTTTNSDTADQTHVFRGRSAVMGSSTGQTQSLVSPYLPNGIGDLIFWYRNWETNGVSPTTLYIEEAISLTSGWVRVSSVTNILSVDYIPYHTALSDRAHHYLRILNATNNPRASLCLDEVVISDPAAGVAFSNIVYSPANPYITNTVTVSVDLYPLVGATNLSAIVWYRAGTNGGWDSVPMAFSSGNTFTTLTPIPRGAAGIMQFYFECAYSGFLSELTSPAYYPLYGSNGTPVAFTNMDTTRLQTFNTWPDQADSFAYVDTNYEEWVTHQACVRNGTNSPTAYPDGDNLSKACWLNSNYDSWVRSPLLSNGVGGILLLQRPRVSAISRDNVFDVDKSYDGVTWWNVAEVTNSQLTGWTYAYVPVMDLEPIYIRFVKVRDDGQAGQAVGLDTLRITYYPAKTVISNVVVHPGYPASNDAVNVSCDIYSANPYSPAMALQSFLYYRQRGASVYTGPIPMLRSGNSFRTDTTLLKFPPNVWVDYYISNNFKGYAYISNSISEKQSPIYYPANGAAGPASFWVREFQSDFDQLGMSLNGDPITLRPFADHVWQGIIQQPPTNSFSFYWSGQSPYNGSNILATTYVWGDNYQWKTNGPLSSTARIGEIPIQVQGDFTGQYLFRFNEDTGAYSFRRCAWQDFDTWGATTNYIATANDNTPPSVQNFNSISASVSRISSDNFNTWPPFNYYTNELWSIGTASYWGVFSARIQSQGSPAVQTTNIVGGGRAYVVRSMLYTPLRGIGTVSFSYCAVSGSNAVGIALRLCPTNLNYRFQENWLTNNYFSSIAPVQTNYTTNWSYTTNYDGSVATNITGTNVIRTPYWTNATVVINTNAGYHVIIAQAADTSSLYIDNVSATEWFAEDIETNGWSISDAWMTTNNAYIASGVSNTVGMCAEFDPSRALNEMYVRTPTMPGISFFEFWHRAKTTNVPVVLRIDFQQNENVNTANWTPLRTITNRSTTWSFVSQAVNVDPQTLYAKMRVVNISPSNGILLVDDITATSVSSATNIWQANNTKIDAEDSTTIYQNRSMYLNSNNFSNVGQPIYSNLPSFLRTIALPDGIGEINFRYRNWAPNGSPPASLLIQKSPTGGTNVNEWATLATLTNIVSMNYLPYVLGLYDVTSHYVRFVNQTPGSRVCLDDVMVAAALASDMTISNLTLSPMVPINSNATHVIVDVNEFFLAPSNIQMTARYAVDTSYNGPQWSNEVSAPMSCIASNTTNSWYRYQTINPIPAQPVDTFVKYYIAASFDGYYSELASPKIYKTFTEPAWYAPLSKGTNVPYYISYNCEPGGVWINEFNIVDWTYYLLDYQGYQYQYIELAGPAGVDLNHWTVEIVDIANNTLAQYVIPANSILPEKYEGFGFFVLGTDLVSPRNMTLTNQLPESGGIRLYRSIGALEYAIAYGSESSALVPYGFTDINVVDNYMPFDGPINLTGAETNYSQFTWTGDLSGNWSPGDRNTDQDILGGGSRLMLTPSIATNAYRGQISPSIPIFVTNNAQTNFVLTASNYWYVADVLTNGVSIGGIPNFTNTFTFVYSNIIAPATVKGVILPLLAPSNTPYEWMALRGFSPNFTAAETNDQDNDGRLTWQEYQEGTDPTNFRSARIILAPTAGSNTTISPSTNFWVYKGGTTNFVITTSNLWIVADILTNGASITYGIPPVSQYSFVYSNIDGDRTTTVQSVAGPAIAANGTPYWWLNSYGWTNNFDAVETNDFDHDGRLTWEEYAEGTNPTNYYSAYIELDAGVNGDGVISPVGPLWIAKGSTTNFIVQANAFSSILAIHTNDAPIANYLVGLDYYNFIYTNIQADRIGSVVAIFTNAVTSRGTPLSWLAAYEFSGDLQAADEGDADNDGRFTWQEYLDGTNPTNFNSAVVCLVPQVDAHGQISPDTNIWVYKGAATNFLITAATYYYVADVKTNSASIAGSFGSNSFLFTFDPIYVDRTGVVRGVIAPYTAALGTPLYWLGAYGFTNNFNQAETNDIDDDGRLTWQEYLDGTNPTNFNSALIEIVPQVDLFGQIMPSTNLMILKGSTVNFIITAMNYYYVASVMTNGVPVPGVYGSPSFDFSYTNIQAYRSSVVYGQIQPYLATQGTPLWWLTHYGFDSDYDLAEDSDTDLDGVSASREYIAGTIPTNRESVFRIVGQGRLGESNYIQWMGGTVGPTNPYGVYYSTNLQVGAWFPTGRVSRANGTNTLWFVIPTNRNAFFYRISATN